MRYIDADALIKKIYPMGIGDGKYTINAKAVKLAIDNAPTADFVPKSEVERLENTYSRAVRKADKKAIVAIQNAKQEVAREIFEEIDILIDDWKHSRIQSIQFIAELAELKKKYIEN